MFSSKNLQQQLALMTREQPMYLYVFPSNKNTYCQMIDPSNGRVLFSYSTLDKEFQASGKISYGNTKESSSLLARFVASKMVECGLTFFKLHRTEKNLKGYYHGRVQSFLETLKACGIRVL